VLDIVSQYILYPTLYHFSSNQCPSAGFVGAQQSIHQIPWTSAQQLASHALTGMMANFAAMMAVLADTGKLNLLILVHRLDV
jgi:hypothetical protein